MLAENIYDGKLSGSAYLILIGMFVVIVGGLSWCFYRAMTAAKKESSEQLPDDV